MSFLGLRIPSRSRASDVPEPVDELLTITVTWGPVGASRMPADPLRGLPETPIWRRKGPTNEVSHHASC